MADRDEFHEVGREIKDQIKHLRKLSTLYCGSKLIAAVVVHEGSTWLWCAGGRSGSHAEMMAEWISTKAMFQDALADAVRAQDAEGIARAKKANDFIDRTIETWTANHHPAVSPPTASRVDRLHFHDGTHSDAVACRRCRQDHRLELTRDLSLKLLVSE